MSTSRRSDDRERERTAPRGTGGRVIRVGNYIVERRLGSGGQADVFLARDVVLRRLVALKVLHRTSAGPNVRALEEARLIATLDHPNVVRVFHVELAEGTWYMAMEYVDGGNLELRVVRAGALEPARALRYALVVADALSHAHKIGVIHRDVKPQNLLETRAGVIKLADFGLAGLRQSSLENTQRAIRLVGTPQYMAPELWTGENATARSDMYGLGATLYFMLTGRPPFPAKNVKDLRSAHLADQPVFPPDIPPSCEDIVLRCMAKPPAQRPSSAAYLHEEIGDALAALSGERRRRARRPGTVIPGTEPPGILTLTARAAADAAVLRLPVFAAARDKLDEALSSVAPITVFHGTAPDALKAIQRAVVDVNGERRFYVAARTMLNLHAGTLGSRLVEQLHLGQWPMPAWHDRVCAELTSEGGGELPTLMELDIRRPLTAAEATDLIELGRRAEGKNIIFLVTCDGETARALLHEVDQSGFSFLLRHVAMRELSDEQRAEYVRTWTHHATGDRLRWTDDALRLLRHAELQGKPSARLIHNALMIAYGAQMRLVTSWSVLGAEQQADYLQTVNEIPMTWRSRPPRWPAEEVLPLLLQLRSPDEDSVSVDLD
jgi:serine/threonine-protein kinase